MPKTGLDNRKSFSSEFTWETKNVDKKKPFKIIPFLVRNR